MTLTASGLQRQSRYVPQNSGREVEDVVVGVSVVVGLGVRRRLVVVVVVVVRRRRGSRVVVERRPLRRRCSRVVVVGVGVVRRLFPPRRRAGERRRRLGVSVWGRGDSVVASSGEAVVTSSIGEAVVMILSRINLGEPVTAS